MSIEREIINEFLENLEEKEVPKKIKEDIEDLYEQDKIEEKEIKKVIEKRVDNDNQN